MKIQIADERVEQEIPVALENIKAEVLEAKPQTFQTLDENGEVVEQTLNIVQPSKIITLKDLEAEISDMEIALINAQTNVESLTAELQAKRDMRDELTNIVQPAFDDLQVAIANKAEINPSPIEKLPSEEIKL